MSDKRTQIIEASIDLFANNGFWNTPTSRITKHAKVSTGTLFNYFESKDALIDQVYLQLRQEQSAHIAQRFPADADVKTASEHIWFRYIDWGIRHPVRYSLLQQMKLSDMVSDEAHESASADLAFAVGVIEQAIADGVFGEISAEYLTLLTIAQLNAAVTYAMQHNLKDMPLTKHITRAFNIYWVGVTQ